MVISFKEFLEGTKASQILGPPKKPRSPKALVNVPHKRNKALKKPTGQPIPVPSANTPSPITPKKKMAESSLLNPEQNPNKSEKAVAIVVPKKPQGIMKYLRFPRGRKSTGKSGYAHARKGSISAPARRNPPKHFKI